MSLRLDPQAKGASVTLGVRFDSAALAIIDREARRLEVLTGEPCDRSRALRSIVRRFGAEIETAVTTQPTDTSSPRSPSPTAERPPTDTSSPRSPSPTAERPPTDTSSPRSPSPTAERPPTDTSSPRSPSPTAERPPTDTSSPRSPSPTAKTAGRWGKVPATSLRQLARELKALDTKTFKRAISETGVARSVAYSARDGKAGEPTFKALRTWLDTNASKHA